MLIEIKNRLDGTFIGNYDIKNNSIKLTVKHLVDLSADLSNADLRGADLRDANLRGANLRGAYLCNTNLYNTNLRDANLRDANLRGADLRGADLRDANLRDANLRGAGLCGADLRGADFRWASINNNEIKSIKLDKWYVVFTETDLAIGCKQYKISEWNGFSNEQIEELDLNAIEFWTKWKKTIFKLIELSFKEAQ